jgi:hypothetical protein
MAEKDIDDRLTEPMSAVDWERVSAAQMAAFGLNLSVLRDADVEQEKVQSAAFARVGALISLVVVGGVTMLLGAHPLAVLAGVVLSQGAGTAWMVWRARQAKKVADEAEQLVVKALGELADSQG